MVISTFFYNFMLFIIQINFNLFDSNIFLQNYFQITFNEIN